MFKKLINEAQVTCTLIPNGPLLIKAQDSGIDPTRPDLQFVRSYFGGKETVYLPGSSLKGVFRSRGEQILRTLVGKDCCTLFGDDKCQKMEGDINNRNESGEERYKKACFGCRMFGTTFLKGRVEFMDAYPEGEVRLGQRTCVAIDRLTGGAKGGPLFQPEVVEDGCFSCRVILKNYPLWQLALLLYLFRDLHDGYMALGMATTRGFGRMKVEKPILTVRDYRREGKPGLTGLRDDEHLAVASGEGQPSGLFHEQRWEGWPRIEELLQGMALDQLLDQDVPRVVGGGGGTGGRK